MFPYYIFRQHFSPMLNCETCNYITRSKKDFNKHLLTRKHIELTNTDNSGNTEIPLCWECNVCNKKYSCRSGLWKHKRVCSLQTTDATSLHRSNVGDGISTGNHTDTFMNFISQSKDFQEFMVHQQRELRNIITEQNRKIDELYKITKSQ